MKVMIIESEGKHVEMPLTTTVETMRVAFEQMSKRGKDFNIVEYKEVKE